MDAYIPFSAEPNEDPDNPIQKIWASRGSRSLTLLGRLKPGVTIKQAQASLNVVAQRIADQHPDTEKGITVQLYPEKLAGPNPTRKTLFLPPPSLSWPWPVSCFSLRVSISLMFSWCALQYASAKWRFAPLLALAKAASSGNTSPKVFCSPFSAAARVFFSGTWAAGILGSLRLGTELPIQFDFHPDARVYLFALAAVLLTGLMVGIMPALRAARTNVITVLHEGGRGSSSGPRRQLARNTLVVAQVAGSLVLLIVAGLFVRSLKQGPTRSTSASIPKHVLNLSVDVAQIGYKEPRGRESCSTKSEHAGFALCPALNPWLRLSRFPMSLHQLRRSLYRLKIILSKRANNLPKSATTW